MMAPTATLETMASSPADAEAAASAAAETNNTTNTPGGPAKKWTAGPIYLTVATSLADDTPQQINFALTLGHGTTAPRSGKRSDANCYFLPSSYNQNVDAFRQRHVHPLFVRACHAAGFLIHGRYEEEGKCVRFECNRANYRLDAKEKEYQAKRQRKVRDPSKPPGRRPNRKSDRPCRERGDVTCKFKFTVYWDVPSQRWFVPKKQKGCVEHCGHEYVDPRQLPLQARFATEPEWDAEGKAETVAATGIGGSAATGVKTKTPSKANGSKKATSSTLKRKNATTANSNISNVHNDFLPMYRTLCAMADANGPEGRRMLHASLERARDEQAELSQQTRGEGEDGVKVHSV